jgi:UDP-glucuronate 4-epimerase
VAAVGWTGTPGAAPGACEIINLGGSAMVPLSRLIALIAQALEVTPRIQRMPEQPGDVRRTCADVAKAGRLLGYQPRVPIERGIPSFVEWYRGSHGSQL